MKVPRLLLSLDRARPVPSCSPGHMSDTHCQTHRQGNPDGTSGHRGSVVQGEPVLNDSSGTSSLGRSLHCGDGGRGYR